MRQFWAMVLQHLEVPGASINLAATVVEEEPEGEVLHHLLELSVLLPLNETVLGHLVVLLVLAVCLAAHSNMTFSSVEQEPEGEINGNSNGCIYYVRSF
jgi:hypothetical protein